MQNNLTVSIKSKLPFLLDSVVSARNSSIQLLRMHCRGRLENGYARMLSPALFVTAKFVNNLKDPSYESWVNLLRSIQSMKYCVKENEINLCKLQKKGI